MQRFTLLLALSVALAGPAAAQPYGDGSGWNPWWGQQGWGGGGPGWGAGGGWGGGQGGGWGVGPGWGPGGWGGGPMMGNPDAPGRGRYAMIDADHDGTISAEEAASAADQVFTAMDEDDDGLLTREEYMNVRMGPGFGRNPQRQAARQAAKDARFGTIDTDGDGSVSKAEFIDGGKAHFEAADANKDGKVTPWEFRRQAWN